MGSAFRLILISTCPFWAGDRAYLCLAIAKVIAGELAVLREGKLKILSIRSAVIASLAILATASPALAEKSARHADIKALAADSDSIVSGRVTGVRTQMIAGAAVTQYTMRVESVLKGAPSLDVTINVPGGAISTARVPVSEVVAGAPQLFVNSEGVLFLNGSPDGAFTIVGSSEGALSIQTDASGQDFVSYAGQNLTMDALRSAVDSAE